MAPDLHVSNAPPPATGGGRVDPNLTFILNLLAGACAGYFLLGQKQKGVVALIVFLLLLSPPSCGTGSMLLALVTAVDGYLQAKQSAAGRVIGAWTFFNSSRVI